MSIIETFIYLFKADSSGVKKGAEEAKKPIDAMEKTLKETNKTVAETGAGLVDMARSFAGMVTAGLALGGILSGFKGAADYAADIGVASKVLNVNTEELDSWGKALQKTGGNVQEFQSTLKNLAQHVGTSPAIALKLLPQLADVFSRMNRFQANRYAQMIGIDEHTLLLLLKGRKGVDELIESQKRLGVVTEEDARIASEYRSAFQNAGTSIGSVFRELNKTVLPILSNFLDGITKIAVYLRGHTGLIEGSFIAIGAAAAVLASPFIVANGAVIGLTVSLGVLIAQFAVIFDDLKAFKEGRDSITGEIVGGLKLPKKYDSLFDFKKSGRERFSDFLHADDPGQLQKYMKDAKFQLALAASTPLNNQTTNSVLNNRQIFGTRDTSVQISEINIVTQATDSEGISTSIESALQKNLWHANGNFDDGVKY